MNLEQYYQCLTEEVNRLINIASAARKKGYDPSSTIEMVRAEQTPERVEEITGLHGIKIRLDELFAQGLDKIEVAFKVGSEIVAGKFGDFSIEKSIEVALRVGLAVTTDCVTASPIEGISHVKIKRNMDGSKYLAVYYLGPIRTAGGTETGLSVILADYLRQKIGLDRYKPTLEEIYRYIEEIALYRRSSKRAGRQHQVSALELEELIKRLPVEVTGPPSEEKLEVTFHRDLERVETNGVRGGALIVLSEGLLLKAKKLCAIVTRLKKTLKLEGWEWLEDFALSGGKQHIHSVKNNGNQDQEAEGVASYLKQLPGGRPVFAFPGSIGGFRIRYGRAPNTGFAAVGLNPATMLLLGGFLAVGTQIKTEKPGKSAIVCPVSSIEGPIVLLRDGSVVWVNTLQEAQLVKDKVERILSVGDILIAIGDFIENNQPFLPASFCEEWWAQELKASIKSGDVPVEISMDRIRVFIKDPFGKVPSPNEAWLLSTKLRVPLHPKYLFFWENLSIADLKVLVEERNSIADSSPLENPEKVIQSLRKLRVMHKPSGNAVLVHPLHKNVLSLILNACARKWHTIPRLEGDIKVLELLEEACGFPFPPRAGSYIGARMGRPEKAKERKLKPPVHFLFPLEEHGGRTRSLNKAFRDEICRLTVELRACDNCGFLTPYRRCDACGLPTREMLYCPKCGLEVQKGVCPSCGEKPVPYTTTNLNLRELVEFSLQKLGIQSIELLGEVKGVKKLMNPFKTPEHIVKGLLRAKHRVFVNKDGTCRFDAVDSPLTHFRVGDIGLTVQKARELGYTKDFLGNPLENEDQICELFYQDIVLPRKAAAYFVRVTRFIDELLEKFYGLEPFYNVKREEDLIGHLVFGLSPHTFVAVVGRVIGFTDAQVQYAHPLFHAAKRRNCDGDEDSLILGLDALLNFSRAYLPSKVGGLEDVPLMYVVKIDISSVDDEVYNLDIANNIPLEFYRATHDPGKPIKEIWDGIKRLNSILDSHGKILFTHPTASIHDGPKETSYKEFKSMKDKVRAQMHLAEIIEGVSPSEVASLVIQNHFIPDIMGNLRNFSYQSFRCVKCNKKFRRPPLSGKCTCGGGILLNVPKGGVIKYVEIAKELTEKYEIPNYLKQRFRLLVDELKQIFNVQEEEPTFRPARQVELSEFL